MIKLWQMRLFLFVSIVFSSSQAKGCDLATIANRFSTPANAYRFEQIKELKGLKRPLRSSGQLWLSPQKILVWQTQTPLRSTLVLSDSQVTPFNSKDEPQPRMTHSAVANLSQTFLALLSGDITALQAQFTQDIRCQSASDQQLINWTIQLTPKSNPIASMISWLKISGDEQLQAVEFEEVSGDKTRLSLIVAQDMDISSMQSFVKIAQQKP